MAAEWAVILALALVVGVAVALMAWLPLVIAGALLQGGHRIAALLIRRLTRRDE
jgi:hypothetical protein